MEIDLPSAAEVLREAYVLLNTPGGSTDRAERAKALVMMARELREGSRVPRVIFTEDVEPTARDVEAAQGAFGYAPLDRGQRMEDDPAVTAVLHIEQPMPTPNGRGSIQALVRHDLTERERAGLQRYGTPLQAFNGRDALRDAYEEALDLACYLRQAIAEWEGTP